MLRQSAFRPALRATRAVRFASSNSNPQLEAAQKKAQEVFASTQQAAGKAFEGAKKVAGPLGERVAGLLGAYRQPITYNLAVAREVVKLVYRAEGLSPPTSVDTIRTAYQNIWARASSREYWQQAIKSGEIARLAIYGLEAYGIFKIGEIIGRRSLVGYNVH
ncbi:hypothetical protein Moror_7934 [Moniliophthora roreri MCA 2997]|uniref:Uncharacterized protein n=2 Tax=Moniliophthora roreri TaxID=221103 RepID=V2YE77_MONRO|nr:hypothetical protein Moror_7934 [Moniliophthora roreri MCA 2997]KAI3604423.1 hypothetical protein WG66_008275 [Moniliophthora roreri]